MLNMNDINGSLASAWFSLELARWKQLVGFELPALENASINVPLVFLDFAESGTDKTVETTWKVEEDGSMSVLETKTV